MRVGFGHDVHRLVAGRTLILGGVAIPYDKGLQGHSDADVVSHAIGDALLGAAGLGDLGQHFPDTDARYRDMSSLKMLREIVQLVRREGYAIGNVDATIICERPRLADHIPQMRENLSQSLEIELNRVNVKATTEEGLGPIGREEGIAAQAVVLLE